MLLASGSNIKAYPKTRIVIGTIKVKKKSRARAWLRQDALLPSSKGYVGIEALMNQ